MKIYLVGGAVRDALLNLPVKDRDWVIVGGTKEMLLKNNFHPVGKDFPVFLHPITREEYALARKERKSGTGHTNFNVYYDATVTLEEDLIRRDLTINAIAQDKYGNYIDPYQGKKDIKLRIIRHVSKSFIEDPLRVLRTARFAASLMHLGFEIARETMELMCIIVKKKELSYLTVNRIWNETEKALKTSNPQVYFQVLYECKALQLLFPEIHFIYDQKTFFNYAVCTCLKNTMLISMGLSKISYLTEDVDIRFSYLCQFLFFKKIYYRSFSTCYDIVLSSFIKNLCVRFNVPLYIQEIAVLNAGFFYFLKTLVYQSSKNIVYLFSKIDAWRKPDRVKKLAFLSNFNYSKNIKYRDFCLRSNTFLEKSFLVLQNISITTILKKGFKGKEIKDELNRLRIRKLELWRTKNYKKY
ncbi:MAG: tRNA CCA-pyrophosphorylase [Buchnera aphidicola (Pentalonia nigronervosa)]|uniref:CCA-adding enzyme n=1 Tax=Buchnera aphidicola (Pentalonia nigronervosa) TaxID=1309793 RepID=A0A7H1AZA4_9GAMM|nr:MAG: tRNA CCA-pyrophosphorylase [Buchnera aphidicola (Pentalonia nigronervosa)]